MRLLLLTALAALCASASAQPAFRLSDPTLFIDDGRVLATGAPLVQSPFGVLSIAVPGEGTFTVSDRPFAGSARAGLFDEDGLFFHAGGRDVRLVSRSRILSDAGPVTAYAQFVPTRAPRSSGPAQLSVADAVDGRGRRSTAREPVTVASGPRASAEGRPAGRADRPAENRRNATADRPAARYLRDDESRRLARQVGRYQADRERLAGERDRVARARTAPVIRPALAVRGSGDRAATLLAAQRALEAERDRLALEADQLTAALGRAEAERDRLAAEFSVLRSRAEAAEAQAARAGRTRGDVARVEAELVRLRAEQAELRSEIQTRDRTIATLTSETRDRTGRAPVLEAELASLRGRLAAAVAERDRALLDRDAALAAADQLRIDLADARADGPGFDLSAERAALDRDRRLLEADRAALVAERAALEAAVRGSSASADVLAGRQDLLAELSAAQADREALMAERAALVAERDRLAAALEARGAALPAGTTIRRAGLEGTLAYLPGFDFAHLDNPDVVRRRLDEAEYPRWATAGRIEGDVLVLFQSDRDGRVVRTAVPTPLGGGLDALAEEIVREMRFVPPVVDGQPTGLRSQVVVRFEL